MKTINKLVCALGAFTALAVGVETAQASCAYQGALKAGAAHMMPGFVVSGMRPTTPLSPSVPGTASQRIVGSWLVTYTAGGSPFAQALIQWHSDGTEWENINLPVESGNICVGSWKGVDNATVTRLHVGWLYTAGLLTGYFTETETDKVTGPNTYSGVNETTIFDLTGHPLAVVPGTANAVRFGP